MNTTIYLSRSIDWEKLIYEFSIILIASLLITAIDFNITTGECIRKLREKRGKIIRLIFFHQVISFFASFGWIANSKIILVLFVALNIIILIHWITNRNRCFVTQQLNNICGIDDRWFPDLFYFVGFKKFSIWNNYLSYIYSILVSIYAIYKILNR